MASDPTIKAALEAAGEAVRQSNQHSDVCYYMEACRLKPCACAYNASAAAIAAFLRALPGSTRNDGALWWYQIPADTETHHWLAAAVEEAARDD
jgi:hypothetical protein